MYCTAWVLCMYAHVQWTCITLTFARVERVSNSSRVWALERHVLFHSDRSLPLLCGTLSMSADHC